MVTSQPVGEIPGGEPVSLGGVTVQTDGDIAVENESIPTEDNLPRVRNQTDPLSPQRRIGGVKGCSHLTDLLIGPLTAVANLTVRDTRGRRKGGQAPGDRPPQLDTCHALASDSPVVEREWPEFHTAKPSK